MIKFHRLQSTVIKKTIYSPLWNVPWSSKMLKWILGIWLIDWLVDWLETSSQSVLCEIHQERRGGRLGGGMLPLRLPWWECEVLLRGGRNPRFDWAIRPIRSQQFWSCLEFRACSWWSCTSGWAPQSERADRSVGPGWQGRTSARRGRCIAPERIYHVDTDSVNTSPYFKKKSSSVQTLVICAAYLSTSEVWLESRGWECLLWRSSSDWTEDTCRWREAWEEKRWI